MHHRARYLIQGCSLIIFALLTSTAWANSLTVTSPDGHTTVTVTTLDGKPVYRVDRYGKPVLNDSRLGLEFQTLANMTSQTRIKGSKAADLDRIWEQPWGERRWVRETYNELLISLERTEKPQLQLDVRFRVFNDGLGFRYEMPAQQGIERVNVMADLSEFAVADSNKTEALRIYGEMWNRYEHLYEWVPVDQVQTAATPISMRRADGLHISIHEAALVDWAGFTLVQRHNPPTLRTKLTPWSDGIAVKATLPFKSSWRTLQIADSAVGLINSDLIINLNEPNKLGDVSWVHPGKYTGVWWEMHRGDKTWGSGEKHGATNAAVKARIDFAAKYGFDGVLVEGWNIGWDGNWIDNGDLFSFTQSYPDFDMAALSAYGAERDVKLIGHHETSGNVENYEAQMGDAYDLYAQHGYEQIKTGYVAWAKELVRYDENGLTRHEWHDGQWAANHYLRTVTEAAKRRIAINTHEPIKDTGLRRTYPNWIAREGARGQEFNSPGAGGAGGDGVSTPDHNVNLVYTRMLSGPMDFTPGIFDLHYEKLDTPSKVKSTLAHQLALYVVLYSPIQMVPDYPEHYEQYPDAFQFIVDVPTDWEQSIALQGEMGDYVVFARQQRGGNDWYLGAITGTEARKLDLPLEFLERGSSYTAEIYRDGPSGHWDENQYDYIVERRVVTSEDRIEASIGRAGGLAVRLVKQ